jgi:hypothetical protein
MITLITGYRNTPNRKKEYFCTNDNKELFFVNESMMLSLPFYISADKVYYDAVDEYGELTGEKFYRNEATASYKLKERELESL